MLAKHSFMLFILESNSVGSKFEQKTADSVQAWLKANKLSNRWSARRYQTVKESQNARAENYSDVIVEERRTGNRFFIECKEFERSNVFNLQFNIGSDGSLCPVSGNHREKLSDADMANVSELINAIKKSEGYTDFMNFLNTKNRLLKNMEPARFWDGRHDENTENIVLSLIDKYNDLVNNGKVEADCKKFDKKLLRQSTLDRLVCALCWRLSDMARTWDICKVPVRDIGKLIRNHYVKNKAEPAKYIQFGDDCLFATSDENPLGLKNIPKFPGQIDGEFSLKFTPRFGTGSVYVTPRSEITSDFNSTCSFINKEKWPSI